MKKNYSPPEDNKSVSDLLELMSAYQKSNVLFTFVELGIAEVLRGEVSTAAEIAQKLGVDPRAMTRFLNAAVNVGLLIDKTDGYANSPLTENFLIENERFYLGGQVRRHQERSSPVWAKLTDRLREWESGKSEETPEDDDQNAEAMAEQHNLALLHGFALGKAFDFSKHRRMLDLGGGTGAMSIALCQSFPKLKSTIFDLPENIEAAAEFIAEEELQNRISTVGGDFKKDELPDEFDIVLMANFMAVADEKENKRLLKKLYKKLPSGGICLLSGWILDDSQLAPQLSVLFCLEDVCWNAPDVERSEAVYSGWLREAGFSEIKTAIYLEPTKFLYGVKP